MCTVPYTAFNLIMNDIFNCFVRTFITVEECLNSVLHMYHYVNHSFELLFCSTPKTLYCTCTIIYTRLLFRTTVLLFNLSMEDVSELLQSPDFVLHL